MWADRPPASDDRSLQTAHPHGREGTHHPLLSRTHLFTPCCNPVPLCAQRVGETSWNRLFQPPAHSVWSCFPDPMLPFFLCSVLRAVSVTHPCPSPPVPAASPSASYRVPSESQQLCQELSPGWALAEPAGCAGLQHSMARYVPGAVCCSALGLPFLEMPTPRSNLEAAGSFHSLCACREVIQSCKHGAVAACLRLKSITLAALLARSQWLGSSSPETS